MLNIPVIETDRLTLRAPRISDYDALCAYFQDPRSRWNGGPRDAFETANVLHGMTGAWGLRGYGNWYLSLRGEDGFIGFAGIFHALDWPEPELGYGIIAEHEGKGLAHEAALAARQAAATHFGLTRLVSYIAPDNTRSQALARRLGAVQEADVILRSKTAQAWRHPEIPA